MINFFKGVVAPFILFSSQKALLINQGLPCKQLLQKAILAKFSTRRKSRSLDGDAWGLNKSPNSV